jgi:uncharacterized protein
VRAGDGMSTLFALPQNARAAKPVEIVTMNMLREAGFGTRPGALKMTLSRTVFACVGIVLLPVAIAGIALPLLPGTPLLILAAFCFARASPRLEAWLVDHPRLGPPIRCWRESGAIPWSAKMAASGAMSISFVWMLVSSAPLAAKVVAGTIMLGAAFYIWSRPDA